MDDATTGQTVFDLFDASSTAVIAVDETGAIGYANPRAGEVFGYEQRELLGLPVEALVPEDQVENHVAERHDYLRAPTARPLHARRDLRGRRRDGTEFAAEVSLTPLETSSGPWVVASVLDVSMRREAEARVRAQSRSYLALARLNEAVAKAEDETTLFRRVCNVAVVHGGFIGAWVATRGGDGSLHIRASAGPLAARLAVDGAFSAASPEAGVTGPGRASDALSTGRASFVDIDQLPGAAADYATRSGGVIPLRSRGRTVATLSLYSDRAGAFDENVQALLLGAAENISLALDRFQAKADLDRALSQRTELLRRLVDAQERERARIAADVHDEPVQALAAVDLRMGLLEKKLGELAPGLVGDVGHIHETITAVSRQLRDLLFELEPVSPSATLTHLLEDAAAHIFELTPVQWTMENDAQPEERELSTTTRTQAVRIAKEALVNSARHAQADNVRIRVAMDDDGVTVRVSDDGVGIPPRLRKSPPGHRGISGMLDRAEVAGGTLSVTSGDVGTTVSVWLPRT